MMNKKELYQQKKQAQLDEWQSDVDKLKAKASYFSADAQLELNPHIEKLADMLVQGKAKLAKIANASEDALESIVEDVDTAWEALKSAFRDTADKFNQ